MTLDDKVSRSRRLYMNFYLVDSNINAIKLHNVVNIKPTNVGMRLKSTSTLPTTAPLDRIRIGIIGIRMSIIITGSCILDTISEILPVV